MLGGLGVVEELQGSMTGLEELQGSPKTVGVAKTVRGGRAIRIRMDLSVEAT